MSALDAFVRQLEQAGLDGIDSPDNADRLRQRLEALDRLEPHLLHGPAMSVGDDSPDRRELHARTVAICERLEAANGALYESLRRAIRRGAGPGRLLEFAAAAAPAGGECYDHLDALVSGILQFEEPDKEIAALEAEMVFYQPTPARHVFDLIARTALTERDLLVDLGSGLGHVPLLTAICTRARSIGIERELAYVECARRSAQALNLTSATFIRQDARAVDFSCGTVFYLYTPFSGAILRDVLDSLRRQAVDREIRVCTYGPCTPIVAAASWLETVGPLETGRIAVFRSRKRTHAPTRARA